MAGWGVVVIKKIRKFTQQKIKIKKYSNILRFHLKCLIFTQQKNRPPPRLQLSVGQYLRQLNLI